MSDMLNQSVNEVLKSRRKPSDVADKYISNLGQQETLFGDEPDSGSENKSSLWRDDQGGIFDPETHATDASGNPIKTKTGRWRKKRGRKTGDSTGPARRPDSANRQSALEAGRMTANVIFTVGQAFGGDEWKPIVEPEKGVNEPQFMTDAWAEYYLATGRTDPPPWLVVVIACGSYALPRMNQPKTQSRIKRFAVWLKGKLTKRKENTNKEETESA